MDVQAMTLVIIPEEDFNQIKSTQQEILSEIRKLNEVRTTVARTIPGYITAKEFMTAVKICRSKFDQLVSENKIKTIKKRRKIYVPAGEVDRYFTDPSIQ
jgi:hypothetical protein